MEVLKLFIILTTSLHMCMGYNVLLLAPVGSRSLYNLNLALGENLINAGHNVTLVTTFNASSSNVNIHHVHTGTTKEEMSQDIFALRDTKNIFYIFRKVSISRGEQMWQNPNILALWKRRNDFHAIVAISYMNEIIVPFLMDYEGAYIGFCTPGVEGFQVSNNGNWLPMSTTPMLFLPLYQYEVLMKRVVNEKNAVIGLISFQLRLGLICPFKSKTYYKFVSGQPDSYYRVIYFLTLGATEIYSVFAIYPTKKNISQIFLKKLLREELEDFMSGSPDGVIYFSLGSIAKSSDIPHEYKEMFVEAFKKVPQRVVWKYEGQDLDLPPNVLTSKWLPQQDILGHTSARIFITHCGNLGTQEAKYHGVPMLAVPISFDQPRNAARLTRKGFAVTLNWDDKTVDRIVDAIKTLIDDFRYRERLQDVYKALQDQKESPGEQEVWWVEYAIRHKNSRHLRYAGKSLNFIQYHLLDVAAFWLVLFIGCFAGMSFCCIRCAGRSHFRSKLDY
ncbi:unnamed protein product, partial [Meganyctiphanes norvegica]